MTQAITAKARWVLLVACVVAAAGLIIGGAVTFRLAARGAEMLDPSSPSARVNEELRSLTGSDPLEGYSVQVGEDPVALQRVAAIVGEHSVGTRILPPMVIGAVARAPSNHDIASLRRSLAADPLVGTQAKLGGPSVVYADAVALANRDLMVGEAIGFGILLLVLVRVFRGWVPALFPLAGALFTIGVGFGALAALSLFREVSGFSVNLVVALGLGLCVDFSLLLITRLREELSAGLPLREAMVSTYRTAGRTVAFSVATICVALCGALVYPEVVISSLGWAGIFATIGAGVFALGVLPGLLFVFGHRIGRIGAHQPAGGGWNSFGQAVCRRPVIATVFATVILAALATPLVSARLTPFDPGEMPKTMPSTIVYESTRAMFDSAVVIIRAPSDRHDEMAAIAQGISSIAQVASVSSPRQVAAGRWRLDVALSEGFAGDGAQSAITAIRRWPGAWPVQVTGPTASLVDAKASLNSHLPYALGIVIAGMLTIFFLLTGSLVVPVKALAMNILTVSATIGGLALCFGGRIEVQTIVLLIIVGLGLSTDYAVFLLARVKEFSDRGLPTGEAVCCGLSRTGPTISAAAIAFCVAVTGMSISSVPSLRQLGIGLVMIVTIDATLVRAVLVPGLMVLLDRRNWWAPRPLTALWHWSGASRWHGSTTRLHKELL